MTGDAVMDTIALVLLIIVVVGAVLWGICTEEDEPDDECMSDEWRTREWK